jgi:hypothetical protein
MRVFHLAPAARSTRANVTIKAAARLHLPTPLTQVGNPSKEKLGLSPGFFFAPVRRRAAARSKMVRALTIF